MEEIHEFVGKWRKRAAKDRWDVRIDVLT